MRRIAMREDLVNVAEFARIQRGWWASSNFLHHGILANSATRYFSYRLFLIILILFHPPCGLLIVLKNSPLGVGDPLRERVGILGLEQNFFHRALLVFP